MKMLSKEVKEIIYMLKSDQSTRLSAIFVFIICFVSSFLISYSLAAIVLSFYLFGLVICYAFIQFKRSANTLLQHLVCFCKGKSASFKKVGHLCRICDDLSCKRNNEDSNSFPRKGLLIDGKLNSAVEKFYNTILHDFVSSWYDSFSSDERFINELKYGLRYSTSAMVRRVLEIDLPILLSKKILPCAVRHIDDYIYMEQIAKLKNSCISEIAVEFLGRKLHAASSSRKNELIYLRKLTTSLLPLVLPKKYFVCRNYFLLFREIVAGWLLLPFMDVLSDPNIINSLIIIGAKYKTKRKIRKDPENKIEFLGSFEYVGHKRKSLFFEDLDELKKDTELLYKFMQFLKSEGHVHLLQFCLDVDNFGARNVESDEKKSLPDCMKSEEALTKKTSSSNLEKETRIGTDEFNNKLMSPDLRRSTLEELYGEAIKINTEYISEQSINFVKCSDELSDELKELLKDGILSIAKIKVSGPLIQAYKEVCDNLEENWLPVFFQTNEFYSYLCGPNVTSDYTKSSLNKIRRNEYSSSPTSKLSSLGIIKSALKHSAPVEGSIFHPEKHSVENESEIGIPVCYSLFRDISMWEISISSYVSLNKVIHFHISVKRPNPISSEMETQRVVLRKDQDFYSLKAKLVEFHGEIEICDSPLPARKAGSDIGARMTGYENFIRKLLQNSSLRGSDLLHTFLTTEEDFSVYISSCGVPVQDLANIYQSVAQKLRKEKGQHLNDFMSIFTSSIGKDKTGRFATPEIGDEVDASNIITEYIPIPKTYRNLIFNDNFGVTCSKVKKASTRAINPVNFMECLLYIGKYIFHVPLTVMRLYVAICSIVSDTVDSIWHTLIRRQTNYVLSPESLECWVTFLREVIFDDPSDPPTKLELENRKRCVVKLLNSMPERLPYTLLGHNFFTGLKSLWEITQHPHYNKHLTYQILDIILIELFPNINGEQKKIEM